MRCDPCKMGADRAADAGGQAPGPPARDRVAGGAGCPLVYRVDRLSVADPGEGLSDVHVRARLFLTISETTACLRRSILSCCCKCARRRAAKPARRPG